VNDDWTLRIDQEIVMRGLLGYVIGEEK